MNYTDMIRIGWGHSRNNKFLWASGFLAAPAIMSLLSAVFVAWRSATFTVAYLQWTGKGDAVE